MNEPMGSVAPDQGDVDAVRGLLDLMANFASNDDRARYLLSSNWLRDRGAAAAERVRMAEQQALLPDGGDAGPGPAGKPVPREVRDAIVRLWAVLVNKSDAGAADIKGWLYSYSLEPGPGLDAALTRDRGRILDAIERERGWSQDDEPADAAFRRTP